MSRYLGPRLRIIRRIGKLRGFTRKKPFRRVFKGRGALRGKVIPPGQHGMVKLFKTRPYDSSESDYLIRLKVKQRLRFNYGLTERQLVNYVRKAKKNKESTGGILLQLLEMRLDNIVFRLNMAPTIVSARQLISHGHIQVNNKKVNIGSYLCKPKDVVSVAMKQKSLKLVTKNLQDYYKRMRFYKNRLEKTLSYILFKGKVVLNMAAAISLIQSGNCRISNPSSTGGARKIVKPNYICGERDIITIKTKTGIREVKMS
uniref:Small ribosomal subunit protein uS4c n=1 Tax=Chloromonas radiata TaxID=47907 RepID=A0A0S2ICD9_9CHLO|nr:ribosomal protein S4 [Chloromonas radiata]